MSGDGALLVGGGVAADATARPPGVTAPTAPRRDRWLALIAIFKLVKVVLLVAVGCGALEVVHTGVARAQYTLAILTSGVDRRLTQRLLAWLTGVTTTRLEALGIGAFLYAALFAVEGIGLWRERVWAEYLTVVVTASFVPLEIYEVVRHCTVVRLSALVINLAVVAYLIRRRRLARTQR